MKALLVEVNGRRVCLAGLSGGGQVTASLTLSQTEGHEFCLLAVCGVDGNEGAIWPADSPSRDQVRIGDEVKLRVIDTDKADPRIKQSTQVTPRRASKT